MTYGAMITNEEGKSILYGAEAIPMCLAAVEIDLNSVTPVYTENRKYTHVFTGIPYDEQVTLFVRLTGSLIDKVEEDKAPFITLKNVNGYLAVEAEGFFGDETWGGWPDKYADSPYAKIRVYIVARCPNVEPQDEYGMVLYDESGRVVFSHDRVMAPIQQILSFNNESSLPILSGKYANMSVLNKGIYDANDGEDGKQLFIYLGLFCTDSGKIVRKMNTRTSSSRSTAYFEALCGKDFLPFIYIDTVYADRLFFNES